MEKLSTPTPTLPSEEQPETLKVGVEFSLTGIPVIVHQIDLPRLTLKMKNPGSEWNPANTGNIIQFGGHHFLIKAATGKRLYLLLVELEETEEQPETEEYYCECPGCCEEFLGIPDETLCPSCGKEFAEARDI